MAKRYGLAYAEMRELRAGQVIAADGKVSQIYGFEQWPTGKKAVQGWNMPRSRAIVLRDEAGNILPTDAEPWSHKARLWEPKKDNIPKRWKD